MKEPSIYELAFEHIQPASGDKTLVRQYVDAAAHLVQDLTGLAITGTSKHNEIVIPMREIDRPIRPMFRVPGRGAHMGGIVKVRTPVDPVTAEVYLVKRGGKRHYIGQRQIVDGEMCLDPIESGCCLDDCDAVAIRLPTVTDDDWPPHVRQAILQIAKWLYEHRGDALEKRPAEVIAASGAGQFLVGYMQ